jgi:DNA modification methylase
VRLDRIEYMPVGDLVLYERRLRTRKDAGKRALVASVSSFGIVLPILIDAKSVVVAGEGILEAARTLGYTEVPTLRVDHLDENEVRLLRIALNKLGEQSDWNRIELAAEFTELLSLDIDLAYEVTGFETPEIDNLIQAAANADEDPDDAAVEVGEPGSAVAQLGDLWEVGEHRVLCGSSLEMESLAVLMGTERAAMVMTDSPFNVKIGNNVSGLGKIKHREFAQASGEMSEAEFVSFLTTSIKALSAHCEDGALLYMYMDWRHVWEMMSGIRAADLRLLNIAVWVKAAPAMGAFYRSQHELCFIAKKGNAVHRNNIQLGRFGRSRSNCWFYAGVNSFGPNRAEQLAMHPTCKDVSMLSDAIRDATHRGEIVLDGFLGSGSTLIAAERTGRVCYGIELDPLYVDVILRRWERATGGKVVLRATGETLEEVAQRRAAEREVPPAAKSEPSPTSNRPEPSPTSNRPEIVARSRTRAAA